MNNYLNVANSSFLAILGGLVFILILTQSALFLRKAWVRGIEAGMDKAVLWGAIRQSVIFSIIPSLPILISLIAMAPVLGIYFPWIRLSIAGSAPYELVAADIGARSMGVAGLGGEGYTAAVFANSMWMMTLGIVWGLVVVLFFLKRIQGTIASVKKRDAGWVQVLVGSLFAGMISVFLADIISPGILQLVSGRGGKPEPGFPVLFISAVCMVFFGWLIKKRNVLWLKDFALLFSMVTAMTAAVLIAL